MAMRWHRSWWLRGALLIFVLIAALAVAWTIWWLRAKSAFDAEVAAYRALSGFSSPSDVRMSSIPEEQDATVVLGKALAAFTLTPASPSQKPAANSPQIPEWPPTSAWMSQAKAAIDANANAMGLAITASSLAEASPTLNVVTWTQRFPMYNVSNFSRFLCDSALYYHAVGDDAAAIDCLLAVQSIPRVYCSGYTLIEPLIAVITQGIASPRIHFIATGLRVEGTNSAKDAIHPATRKQVQQLLATLRDDRSLAAAVPHGLAMETGRSTAFWTQSSSILITRPLFYRLQARWMSTQRQCIVALEQLDWSAAESAQRQVDAFASPTNMGKSYDLLFNVPRFTSVHRDLFAALTARRMATVALAFRLYVLDHGDFPQSLTQLVPECLPAIPVDPYSADHDPLGYLPADQGTRPLVLSVGPRRLVTPQVPPLPTYVFNTSSAWLVVDLARPRPTQPPSSAPAR